MKEFFYALEEVLNLLLGLDTEPGEVLYYQLIFRAVLMYVVALALVRVGRSRLFGKNSAFDVILGVILGSVLSRGINGVAPYFGTMALGMALIGMHWFFGYLAYRVKGFAGVVKGKSTELVRDGQVLEDNMRRNDIDENDLKAAMRTHGQTLKIADIEVATLEPSGNISVVKKEKTPHVVEIEVQEGVQKIWIAFK